MEHTWTKDFYQETDPAKRQQILKEHIGEEEAWEEEYRDRLWTARYGQRRLQKDEFVKCLMEVSGGRNLSESGRRQKKDGSPDSLYVVPGGSHAVRGGIPENSCR